MRRDVFQAIADPMRGETVNMLAARSLNLNAVAENFDVSRLAISKRIKILTEYGLVVIKQKSSLNALENHLVQMQADSKSDSKSKGKSINKVSVKKNQMVVRRSFSKLRPFCPAG